MQNIFLKSDRTVRVSETHHVGADGFIFVTFFGRFVLTFNYQYAVAFEIFTIKYFIHTWQSSVHVPLSPSGDYISFSIHLTKTKKQNSLSYRRGSLNPTSAAPWWINIKLKSAFRRINLCRHCKTAQTVICYADLEFYFFSKTRKMTR